MSTKILVCCGRKIEREKVAFCKNLPLTLPVGIMSRRTEQYPVHQIIFYPVLPSSRFFPPNDTNNRWKVCSKTSKNWNEEQLKVRVKSRFLAPSAGDRRNRADLIESATLVMTLQWWGPYRDANPLRLTVLAAMSEDYTTAPRHEHKVVRGVIIPWKKSLATEDSPATAPFGYVLPFL